MSVSVDIGAQLMQALRDKRVTDDNVYYHRNNEK